MSRSGEARKPLAKSRVKVLADENAALRADRSSLETRVKELRAELDAAARVHREVRTRLEEAKARMEGENAGIQGRLNERDRAALKLTGQLIEAGNENTRLKEWLDVVEPVVARSVAALGQAAPLLDDNDTDDECQDAAREAEQMRAALAKVHGELLRALKPASDNVPFRNLDQAGTVGTKPEGLAAVQPDPEGRPSRSTSQEQP